MTGKELFSEKTITINDKQYTLKFTFRSLMEIQEKCDDDLKKVFEVFNNNMNAKKTMLMFWACLVEEHKEFRSLTEKDIFDKMIDLINPKNQMEIQIACSIVFSKYWIEVKESEKELAPEYQSVLDEFMRKGKKKK